MLRTLQSLCGTIFCGGLVLMLGVPAIAYEFAEPFRLKAADQWIDTEIGHAAPFIADFTGDGVNDLLVGQFGDGKLKIYRNVGDLQTPRYDSETWFRIGDQAEGDFGKIPAG
jgi:hypothetical protein